VLGIAGTIVLSGLSSEVVGSRGNHFRFEFAASSSCTTPNLSGTVVNVVLTIMVGPMMGKSNAMMFGGRCV
jgi:hypothetical protein